MERREKLKTKWAQMEAVVGAEKRGRQIAEDIVAHFGQRLEALEGKAMVVCMSRRICIDLYRELVRLRPDWHDDDDDRGSIKVVMTGSASDPPEWQPHIRNKARREALANRFRDPADPLQVVLVRDMWLTGFDAPSLHTMYVDKPMRGHGLMQAIARVNRVFKDKPGGLVVDYLGLAQDLKTALATYTESGGTGRTALDQDEAVAVMLEKYEVCCALFHGFDWSKWTAGNAQERLGLLPAAQEHVLAQEDGKERCLNASEGSVASLRAGRAAPGDLSHPGRRGLLPGGAGGAVEAGNGRGASRGGSGPGRAADHLTGGGLRRRAGHLRHRGTGQAGHLGALRRVPGRGARNASAQPRRGSCCRSCSKGSCISAVARTWCRPAPSPRCWSRPCAATRTGL